MDLQQTLFAYQVPVFYLWPYVTTDFVISIKN